MQKPQNFNDGTVNIYKVENIALAGNKPKEGLIKKVGPLRHKERVVGMGRYWTALQSKANISLLLRVQRLRNISTQDIAIPNDGQQYKIVQIQYPEDIIPPVMDLSLERIDAKYEIAGH